MQIGMIGTGSIGGTIARKLIAAGHDVRVANSRGPDGVRQFAEGISAKPVDVYGAVDDVDVVILSIPMQAIADLPADLFDAVEPDTVVIDTGNYYPGMRDSRIPDIDEGMPESVWVSNQIAHPVIKAFNNALALTLAELGFPAGTPGRLALAVAGDDIRSKRVVMQLVDQTGFDPVDSGSLEESWRQQPSTPAYCCDYDAAAMRMAIAAAVMGDAPRRRDQLSVSFAKLGPNPSHDAIIAMNRKLNSAA